MAPIGNNDLLTTKLFNEKDVQKFIFIYLLNKYTI
jgi:hypothetical protein